MTTQQRTFLELTHNPFVPPREGFFGGAERKTHLDHIRHLSQWSRRILLVTGAFGMGKSTLFAELSGNLEARTKGARLSGTVLTSQREVLVGIARGFGVAIADNLHGEQIVDLIISHSDVEHERERLCMVMVDDAHLLSADAIEILIELVARSSIRLVLFAESAVIGSVSRACKRQDLEWFEIRMAGFPRADVREYLEWRFAQANYRGRLPFTDAQVDKIADRSGGNPHVIDMMANELLTDLEAGGGSRPTGFPRQHAVLVVLLAALLTLAWFVFQPETLPPQTSDVPDQAQASEPTAAPATVPEREVTDEVDEVADETAGDILERPTAPAELPNMSLAGADADDTEPTAQAPPAPATERMPQTEPTPQSPSPSGTNAALQGRNPSATTNAREPDVVPAQPVASDTWLLQQDPAAYTLQLLTLSNSERAQSWIAERREPAEYALVPVQRGERRLYVVTYGVFSSRAAAQRAVAALAGELGDIEPWIRQVSALQQAASG